MASGMIRHRHITIISASETGNSREVAEELAQALHPVCPDVRLVDAFDYAFEDFTREDVLLMVTSTQGEGEPPMEAEDLYEFVMSETMPRLEGVSFAVLGLGDSSYGVNYNLMVRQFDARYADLGARRLMGHGECDLDYEATARRWIATVVTVLRDEPGFDISSHGGNGARPECDDRRTPTPSGATGTGVSNATVTERERLTSASSSKQVFRIRLAMSKDVGEWQPGDLVAVGYVNDVAMLDRLLRVACGMSVADADPRVVEVLRHRDVSALTPSLIARYAAVAHNADLDALLDDETALNAYAHVHPTFALFKDFPSGISLSELPDIFSGKARRLYSAASAMRGRAGTGNPMVDLTVTEVAYDYDGARVVGACSGYLTAARLGTTVMAGIVPNPRFHMPADDHVDIVMVGLGSAIAPYRAFLQRRAEIRRASRSRSADASQHVAGVTIGRTWLILGNRNPREDYLYHDELERYHDDASGRRLDIAWSRFGSKPRHVQDLIADRGARLWEWIDAGANVYLCGHDGAALASIRDSLVRVVAAHGELGRSAALDYVNAMERSGRLHR